VHPRGAAPILDAANEGLFDVATSGDLIKQSCVHCQRIGLAGELKQFAIRGVD